MLLSCFLSQGSIKGAGILAGRPEWTELLWGNYNWLKCVATVLFGVIIINSDFRGVLEVCKKGASWVRICQRFSLGLQGTGVLFTDHEWDSTDDRRIPHGYVYKATLAHTHSSVTKLHISKRKRKSEDVTGNVFRERLIGCFIRTLYRDFFALWWWVMWIKSFTIPFLFKIRYHSDPFSNYSVK